MTRWRCFAWLPCSGFNPHTHEGCDMRSELYCQLYKVSIHTPTKGVTRRGCAAYATTWVSIHTPTKGVTRYFLANESDIQVSIHTPTKGVTWHRCKYHEVDRCFNPHTHEGCDAHPLDDGGAPLHVSIHTPTKGVTFPADIEKAYKRKFQSTHPRRV